MSDPDQTQLGLGLDLPELPRPPAPTPAKPPAGTVVRVQPDVVGIPKLFDYVVSEGTTVEVGDVVRVRLGPRSVRGWVVEVGVTPDPGIQLAKVTKVSGRGPTQELVELADWAAWRWAGRPVHFLRTATPSANVTVLPRRAAAPSPVDDVTPRVAAALDTERAVLALGPAEDRYQIARAAVAAAGDGHALLLCPAAAEATALARRLRRDGVTVALLAGQEPPSALAREWAQARAGATVVGTRAAAWAPLPDLGRVVVFDEHDESYQGEQTPTWNARDVVAERAARAGVPCLKVSPTPSLEAIEWGRLIDVAGGARHHGWPPVEVVDQRELDPDSGPLFSPRAVQLARDAERVVFVLNRTGRVRLLACGVCASIARCADCDGPVSLERDEGVDVLVCNRDDHRRPPVCLDCGASTFKNLRLGIGRAREELEVLAGRPVGEVTGASDAVPDTAVLIGTEAVLHRVPRADAAVFLDMDQHLLSTRFRAAEDALALLARAGRIVARSSGRGRVVIQTRTPDHPAVLAATSADLGPFWAGELAMRTALGLPPATAMALVSGAGAPAFMASFGAPDGVSVQGPLEGTWRLRTPDHTVLCDAIEATERPDERLRIEVDPLNA